MLLLGFDEIAKRLDEQFLPLEPDLNGFRLLHSRLKETDIRRIESILRVTLSNQSRELLLKYDLGNLTIGPISFCTTGDYVSWLIAMNAEKRTSGITNKWWTGERRPDNQLLIALSDDYAVCLDTHTDHVKAFRSGSSPTSAVDVADSFPIFLQAIGTVFLIRNDQDIHARNQLAVDVNKLAGGEDDGVGFWQWLAA